MQKYVIVHFIDKDSVPEKFTASEWPLHITLLANFTLISPLETLIKRLDAHSKKQESFVISVNGEDKFGPNKKIAVSLIKPTNEIKEFHQNFVKIAETLGANFDEPEYVGDGYHPHATIQVKSRLYLDQAITVSNFTLVDMFPDENINMRRLIKHFEFQS